jgi:hypothetical protein
MAPKYSTYGYDVIAQIGWERQKGRERYAAIQADLAKRMEISESQVRYLYHDKYLPLLACHERTHLAELEVLARRSGLLLSLDGLMPVGGEPQLWVVRELQSDWTLRCGWLERQDEQAFIEFLRPIADLNLMVRAIISDKQKGLLPAVAVVFPHTKHGWCHAHYFKNAAAPVAEADEAMKSALRKNVRAEMGDLLKPPTLEKQESLTVTGMIPSAMPEGTPLATATPASVEAERESIIQDIIQRVRYLLTLKGRPPFRLAGVETFERLEEVKRCLDQLIRHRAEPRLVELRDGLRQALKAMRADYLDLHQAADWLERIAHVLDPDGKPARSGTEVRQEWQTVLDEIKTDSQASPRLQAFGHAILKVSKNYAPGLFHTYDIEGLPRTNNDRESEFRDLSRRLLSTTGQVGGAKRIVLKEGAWELIPGPSSLPKTVEAISQVSLNEFLHERQRMRAHRGRFRLHTRSAKQSQTQLRRLVRRWQALPSAGSP